MEHPIQHPLCLEILKTGLTFEAYSDSIGIHGFSKAGQARLYLDPADPSRLVAHTRYGETELIYTVRDLVELSLKWWRRYADWGYECPPNFKPLFVSLGLVKIETITTEKTVFI